MTITPPKEISSTSDDQTWSSQNNSQGAPNSIRLNLRFSLFDGAKTKLLIGWLCFDYRPDTNRSTTRQKSLTASNKVKRFKPKKSRGRRRSDYFTELEQRAGGGASKKCAEPWMAEPKRHRDVPQERFFGGSPTRPPPPSPSRLGKAITQVRRYR